MKSRLRISLNSFDSPLQTIEQHPTRILLTIGSHVYSLCDIMRNQDIIDPVFQITNAFAVPLLQSNDGYWY